MAEKTETKEVLRSFKLDKDLDTRLNEAVYILRAKKKDIVNRAIEAYLNDNKIPTADQIRKG